MTTTFQSYVGQVNVKDYGALGDNSHDDTTAIQSAIDAAFGTTASPHGSAAADTNRVLYFPPGTYKITSALTFRSVRGGIIRGAGRFVTTINQVTTGGADCVVTNGFEYCRVEGFLFQCPGSSTGAICFDLDWDGTGTAALQSNTFSDCFFGGGDYGCTIGRTGSMGSENTFINCFWGGIDVAGLYTGNYNALQNVVIGGDFQDCAIGIWVNQGSVSNVVGTGFQVNATWDIKISNSTYDTMSVLGARTESDNFMQARNGQRVTLSGITQTSSNAGTFFDHGGDPLVIENCVSLNGKILVGSFAELHVRCSRFGRSDWISDLTGATLSTGSFIKISDVTYNFSGTPVSIKDQFIVLRAVTIATGAITITGDYHIVDTEAAAASDDLDTITGGIDGQRLILRAANSSRDVVVKDGTNLKLAGDFTLNNVEDTIQLIYDGSQAKWLELGRSDNGA